MDSHSLAMAAAQYVGRILVIAEEFEVVDALTEYFADLGYEAHGAIDGPDALDIVRRSAPEVILLDVPSPRLADLFRQLRAARDVPILIATDNPETARQLRPLGAFAYIRKPFIWDDLRRRVATVLYSTLYSGGRRV